MAESFKSQSIKHLIVAILAMIVGAVNNIFIFSGYLALKGQYDFIVNTGYILAVLFSFGIPSLSSKYLPLFKTEDDRDHGFLSAVLTAGIVVTAFACIFGIGFLYFNPLNLSPQNAFMLHGKYILGVGVLVINMHIIIKYLNARTSVDVPIAVSNLLNKVFIGILVFCIGKYLVDEGRFNGFIVLVFFIQVVLLLWYLAVRHRASFAPFSIPYINKTLPEDFSSFLLSGLFMAISYSVLDKIDHSMLGSMVGFKENGIYGINNYISGLVLIPFISTYALYSYSISQHMYDQDFTTVGSKYKATSDYLIVSGIFITLAIWSVFDVLAYLSPKMAIIVEHKNLFLILAIGHLANMAFSINEHILVFGSHFRINNILVIAMIIFNILLNYLLIPHYTMYGAAIATMLSYFVFNLLKSAVVYHYYRLNVIDSTTFKVLALGIITYLILQAITLDSIWLATTLKVLATIICFAAPCLWLGFSTLLSQGIKEGLEKVWRG